MNKKDERKKLPKRKVMKEKSKNVERKKGEKIEEVKFLGLIFC